MNKNSHLKGKRVLVTRLAGQAKEVIAKLRRSGAKVIHIPLIEIADPSDKFRSLDRAISRLERYDWLIFTSQNAVSKFFKRLSLRGARQEVWRGTKQSLGCRRFAAVGPATAAALKKYGIRKVLVPRKNNYSADGLVAVLKKYNFKGKRVLFPSAKKAKDILPKWLKKQGAKLDKVQAYQTIIPRKINRKKLKELISKNKVDEVLFYSSSAVKNFTTLVGKKIALNFQGRYYFK
jgi:uroporphyrinogen-III synthase